MPILLALPLAIYGTLRLIDSSRSGVYHLAVIDIDRASQPGRFRFNMAALATAVVMCWAYVLVPFMTGAITITIQR